jgi:uncharacterized protein
MQIFADYNPYYSLAGLFVGLLVGLTGVGGGSLMTPLLVLLFKFHPATAVGTDLLYAAMTKSVGSVVHGWRSTVDWKIVRRLGAGSVPAALATLAALQNIGAPSERASAFITVVLGFTLILTSVAVLYQARLVAYASAKFGARFEADHALPTIFLGLILGVLVTVTSVGAGAIGATALLILYPKLPVARIVGSDIAHAVPLTLIAGAGHWMMGNVNWPLLASLLVGSIPGIVIGSYVGSGASDKILRPLLAIVLMLVGGKLLL